MPAEEVKIQPASVLSRTAAFSSAPAPSASPNQAYENVQVTATQPPEQKSAARSVGPPRLTHVEQQTPQHKNDQRSERTERSLQKERLPRAAPLELVPVPPAAASTPKPSPTGTTTDVVLRHGSITYNSNVNLQTSLGVHTRMF